RRQEIEKSQGPYKPDYPVKSKARVTRTPPTETLITRTCRGYKMAKDAMFAVLLCVSACLISSPTQGDSSVTLAPADSRAVQAVHAYVSETRKWPKDGYRLELDRRDGNILTFWVIHRDFDEAIGKRWRMAGGGGKSFAVEIDEKTLRVIREPAFQ